MGCGGSKAVQVTEERTTIEERSASANGQAKASGHVPRKVDLFKLDITSTFFEFLEIKIRHASLLPLFSFAG